jgi:hypothetical protein
MGGFITVSSLDTPDEERKAVGECVACWGDYPRQCRCGGLVHSTVADSSDDGVLLALACDNCGTDYWEKE